MKSRLSGIFSRAFGLHVVVLVCTLLVMIDGSSELHNHRREVQAPGMASTELLSADKDSESAPRTATGGVINTLLVLLTIVSFIGNAMFLVYVFWLSK